MNRRANLYLNIYDFIIFILCITSMGLCLILREVSFPMPVIIRAISFVFGAISGLLFIAIELFLFIIMNKKSKAMYIGYMLIDIGLAIILTTKLSFAGFIVLIIFKLVKDILRIRFVENLYIPKEFDRYCKMFNINIADFKKTKKKAVKVNNKEKIKIPVNEANATLYISETETKESKNSRLKKAAI